MITSQTTGEAVTLLQDGMAAAKAGDKASARAAFQRATELEPNNEHAWLCLASACTELPEIAQCLQRVLLINPNNHRAAEALRVLLRRMQTEGQPATTGGQAKPGDATQTGTSASSIPDGTLSSGPLSPSSGPLSTDLESLPVDELKRRGIVAAKGGHIDEARACLLAAIAKDEEDAETWFWLSTVIEDPDDKQIALENVLTLDPLNSAAGAAMEEISKQKAEPKGKNEAPAGTANPDASSLNSGPLVSPNSDPLSGPLVSPNSGPLVSGPLVAPNSPPSGPLVSPNSGPLSGPWPSPQSGPLNGPPSGPLGLPASGPLSGPPSGPLGLPNSGPLSGPLVAPNSPPSGPLVPPNSGPLVSGPLVSPNSGPLSQAQLPAQTGSQSSPPGYNPKSTMQSGPLGPRSTLFVPAGHAAEGRGVTGELIAEQFRVISAAGESGDMTYVVFDVENRTYFIMKPHTGGVAELKQSKVSYVVYKGEPYVLEAIKTEGLSLSSLLETTGPLPPDLATEYGLAMLKTLAADHEKGLILTAQKQVTPDTIALDAAGHIVLKPSEAQLAGFSASVPAQPFLPPEQAAKGTPPANALAPSPDIFSVGAVLYYLLTGVTPPLGIPSPKAKAQAIDPSTWDPRHVFAGVPDDLAQVIATALQPNPIDRYSSAAEMTKALRATEAGSTAKKDLPITQIAMAAAGIVCVLLVSWVVFSGRLSGIKLPSLSIPFITQAATPTALPLALQPPTPMPVPLSRIVINAVDARKFPLSTVYFSAVNSTGAPVGGLGANAVKLRENGTDVAPNQFTELRRTTDPISVIIALDTSARMAGKPMDDAKTAIHIFADLMEPGDQMALMTFGDGVAQSAQDYTVSKTRLLSAVDRQQGAGNAALGDVISLAASTVMTQFQGGYTAMVVVSNGDLPRDGAAVEAMLQAARAVNLPVFYVGLDQATFPAEAAGQLTAGTGGMAFAAEVPDAGGAGEAIKKVERYLHGVYKLTYDATSPDPKAIHELELTVTAGDVVQADKRQYQVWKLATDSVSIGGGADPDAEALPTPIRDP